MQFEAMASQVGELFLQHKLWLCTAESCTGGGLAHCITAIDGSSCWFERGFVTYSNLAKQQMLSVPADMIEQYGAVSEEIARRMASGAVVNSEAQVAVAITGIAGPGGGSKEKPVGTVYFAWHWAGNSTMCKCHHFSGDRAQVRQQAIERALKGLLQMFDEST